MSPDAGVVMILAVLVLAMQYATLTRRYEEKRSWAAAELVREQNAVIRLAAREARLQGLVDDQARENRLEREAHRETWLRLATAVKHAETLTEVLAEVESLSQLVRETNRARPAASAPKAVRRRG